MIGASPNSTVLPLGRLMLRANPGMRSFPNSRSAVRALAPMRCPWGMRITVPVASQTGRVVRTVNIPSISEMSTFSSTAGI
jgi:hypothetical protein